MNFDDNEELVNKQVDMNAYSHNLLKEKYPNNLEIVIISITFSESIRIMLFTFFSKILNTVLLLILSRRIINNINLNSQIP